MKLEIRNLKFGLVAGLLLAGNAAHAIEFVQRDQFISSTAETLRNEMWISAQTVTISGEALDDLFLLGGTLDLRGSFKSDVWAAGGDQVIAAGHFNDHVRLAARTVQVSGELDSALTAMGNTVKIAPSATLSRDMLCIGENIISEGTVSGNVRIIAKKATLGGKIQGNVSVTAQEIVILPGTVIEGNLNYTAPKELVLSPSVHLAGNLTRILAPPAPAIKPLGAHFGFALAALITGLFFNTLFPVYTASAVHLLKTTRVRCMLTGFITFFLVPLCAFLLLFTFIGLPLSILVFLFYFILLYLSKIAVGFLLGAVILRRKEITRKNRAGTLAAGLLVIYALTAFTAISLVVNILIIISGLGALLLALFKKPVLIVQTPNDIKQPTTED